MDKNKSNQISFKDKLSLTTWQLHLLTVKKKQKQKQKQNKNFYLLQPVSSNSHIWLKVRVRPHICGKRDPANTVFLYHS